jgi:hypothetical protein
MAVRRLAALTPSTANTATVLATADRTYVASVIATNVSDVDAVVTIYVKPFNAGEEASAWSFLGKDIALSAGQSFETFRFAIESGDQIVVSASTVAVNFTSTAIYEAEGRSNITVSVIEPTFPVIGDIWLSSLTDVFSIWNGSDWAYVAAATPVGPQGATGPTGPTGEQGLPSVDFSVLGVVATAEDLPEFGTEGTVDINTGIKTFADAYYVSTENTIYAWRASGWVNVGPIQGPTGPERVSFTLVGDVFTASELPATPPDVSYAPLAAQNAAYYVYDEEIVYVWNTNAWFPVGPIFGPTGPTGAVGVTGPTGPYSYNFNVIGTVADYGELAALTPSVEDAYYALGVFVSPDTFEIYSTGLYLWAGTEWILLDTIVGPIGPTGAGGEPGAPGPSAYELAISSGLSSGTLEDYIVSLVGPTGPQGPLGAPIQLKGSVDNTVDLPPSGNAEYDVWNVTGVNAAFVWDGSTWVELGALVGATGATGPAGDGAVDVTTTAAAATFVGLYESASGTNVGGKTNTGITYNATSGTLTVTAIETQTINAPASLTGTYELTSPTTITLNPVDEVILTAPAVLPVKTTAELAALTSSVGAIAYNSDDVGIAVYDGSSWATVLTTTGPPGDPGEDGADGASVTQNYQVSNNGSGNYVVDGASNPTLTLVRGRKYFFTVNASGHPFWIQTTGSGYVSGNAYNTGVTNNGTEVGGVEFTVDATAPNTLYYQCQYHAGMVGTINIIG